ncbi:Hint domain-containing protein [Paracoccus sp. Ld10]|uniref:Hint domain-containing protein n=1 Tax=Paracoccus sp. Ld10 TaxID=649158 RepID=UPI003864927E
MTTFSIRGDQLLVNPSVGTNSSQGTATVQRGTLVWTKDHRIEITAINDTGSELTGKSAITNIKVYDASGKLIAEYNPMNPGQTAGIQSDISGLGDDYARINTSVMKASSGAPQLGQIIITNGTNSFTTLPQTFPVGNGAYDIAPVPLKQGVPPCFGPDVLVDVTRAGVIPVREVQVGDSILTAGGRQPVIWKGHRHCSGQTAQDWPVDLNGELFSPLHRIFWHGRWAKAKHLAEAGRATLQIDHGEIQYHHILLPVHSVILTAHNRVESLLMTPYSLSLWDHLSDLGTFDGASVSLTHDEWPRGDLLRHERRAGPSVSAKKNGRQITAH